MMMQRGARLGRHRCRGLILDDGSRDVQVTIQSGAVDSPLGMHNLLRDLDQYSCAIIVFAFVVYLCNRSWFEGKKGC